jgi:hypothetical protein
VRFRDPLRWTGFLLLSAGPAVAFGAEIVAESGPYLHGWSLSASSTDPYVQVAPFQRGTREFYLWYACGGSGAAAADLTLRITGAGNAIVAFLPSPGWSNPGTAEHLALIPASGCAAPPSLVGKVVVDLVKAGTLCLDFDAWNVSQDCVSGQPFTVEWVGVMFGGRPCGTACYECLEFTSLCLANAMCDVIAVHCDAEGNCFSGDYCDCRVAHGDCGRCSYCTQTATERSGWGRLKAGYR